jgi:hypothetical protein
LGHAEIGTAHDALMTVHDAPSAKAEVGVPLEPMPSHGLTKSTYISVLISVPASYAFPEIVRLSPIQRGSRPEFHPGKPVVGADQHAGKGEPVGMPRCRHVAGGRPSDGTNGEPSAGESRA